MYKISIYLYMLILIGIILIFGGTIYGEHGVDLSIVTKIDLSSFIKELGFACVIGFLISIIIERAAREEEVEIFERYVKESGRNVLRAVYGHNISDNLFDFINKNVLSIDFVRSDANVLISIALVTSPAKQEYVSVTVRIISKIVNVSGARKKFEGHVFVEKPNVPHFQDANRIKHVHARPKDVNLKIVESSDNGQSSKMRYEFDAAPSQTVEVESLYVESKLTTDVELWRSVMVTEQIQFIITHPKELEVGYDVMHPEFDYLSHSYRDDDSIAIKIDRPLLPQNGLVLWWTKRSEIAVVPKSPELDGEKTEDLVIYPSA